MHGEAVPGPGWVLRAAKVTAGTGKYSPTSAFPPAGSAENPLEVWPQFRKKLISKSGRPVLTPVKSYAILYESGSRLAQGRSCVNVIALARSTNYVTLGLSGHQTIKPPAIRISY